MSNRIIRNLPDSKYKAVVGNTLAGGSNPFVTESEVDEIRDVISNGATSQNKLITQSEAQKLVNTLSLSPIVADASGTKSFDFESPMYGALVSGSTNLEAGPWYKNEGNGFEVCNSTTGVYVSLNDSAVVIDDESLFFYFAHGYRYQRIKIGVQGVYGKIKTPYGETVDLNYTDGSTLSGKFANTPCIYFYDDNNMFGHSGRVIYVCRATNLVSKTNAAEEYLVGASGTINDIMQGTDPDNTYDLVYPITKYVCTQAQTASTDPMWAYRVTISESSSLADVAFTGSYADLQNTPAIKAGQGVNSIIEGDIDNNVAGDFSHAEGYHTQATNSYSHAEGNGTKASGSMSHAEGRGTTASSSTSHAEGTSTTASGPRSHAEGTNTTSSGDGSHAEGGGTTASGPQSHAEGDGSTASAFASHAEGSNTTASGNSSHAEGIETIANHKSQHVFGEYNIADPSLNNASTRGTYIEIVGNGATSSAMSNARTLDWNGNEVLTGKITANGVNLNDALNLKQDALGFTPEDVANKKTGLAENSDSYYPTQKAVKTAVDAKATGAASSTDNEVAVYDGTTGKALKSGSGVSAVGGNLTATNDMASATKTIGGKVRMEYDTAKDTLKFNFL